MSRFHRLEVAEVRRETDECVSVRLDVPPDLRPVFAFAAGQHLILKARIGGEDHGYHDGDADAISTQSGYHLISCVFGHRGGQAPDG